MSKIKTFVSFQEAWRIAQDILPIAPETMSLEKALRLRLARAVKAPRDDPPYALSLMDGYGVLAQDTPGKFFITTTSPIQAGQAYRVRTGMPLPQGADAVVLQEDVVLSKTTALEIKVPRVVSKAYVREPASLFHQGATLLEAGTRIKAEHVALMASVGVEEVVVYPPLRIAIAAVGDELKHPKEPLRKGEVVDVSQMLGMWLRERYEVSLWHGGIIPDHPEHLRRFLERALAKKVDMIITMGGSGQGATDHTNSLLSGARCCFRRVAIQPGMPTQLGIVEGCPLLILPGRVLSAFMMLATLGKALVEARGGISSWSAAFLRGKLSQDCPARHEKRDSLVLATLTNDSYPLIEPLPLSLQRSDSLWGLTKADGYILQRAGTSLLKGQETKFFSIRSGICG